MANRLTIFLINRLGYTRVGQDFQGTMVICSDNLMPRKNARAQHWGGHVKGHKAVYRMLIKPFLLERRLHVPIIYTSAMKRKRNFSRAALVAIDQKG